MSNLASLNESESQSLSISFSQITALVNKRLASMGLVAVVILYLLLAIAFSQLLHFSRSLDEGYHLEYITFIKQHGRLPVTYEERSQITRADFPPLYQLFVAGLSAHVDVEGPPYFKNFWDSFRYRAIDHLADEVWMLDTEDYQRPYLGRFLVWQIGRWFSICLSLTTLIVVFLTLLETPLGQKPLVVLAGVALLAFIPRYIMLGSALNDDNLLGLLAALYFWMVVKVINQPERWWPVIAMGIFLGMSMTVKYTLVLVPFEIVLICAVIAWKNKLGWSWAGRRIIVAAGMALLFSSWWFAWNIWFLNTVAEDGWPGGLLRPILAGGHDTTLNRISGFFSGGQAGLINLPDDTNPGTFSEWLQATFLSFWAGGTADTIPFSPYVYWLIGLMLVISSLGLWRLWQTEAYTHKWLILFIFHMAIFVILPLLRFGLTRRLSVAAQGRHILIPAATAIVALWVWGLATTISPRRQRPIFALIIAGFMVWTGAHLYQIKAQTTPALPLRTSPQAGASLAQAVQANFGDIAELSSYEVDPRPEQGVLRVNLAWRSLNYTTESYLLKVALVDANEDTVSYWLGHHGQGRLPTLAWEPDDVIFDRLTLPLPNLPAGNYTLRVQLLGQAGALPIRQTSTDEQPWLSLTTITLNQVTSFPFPDKMRLMGDGLVSPVQVDFALWRADGRPAQDQNPTYRYPATISIITSQPDLMVTLVDAAGQTWPATHQEANIHAFVIGPQWQSGHYSVQVALQQDGEVVGQATGPPWLTVENWWERNFTIPEIAAPVEANFANQIQFLGYKLPQSQVKAGEAFPLTLYWQAPLDKSPQAEFIQFNHLLDSSGVLRGGYDRQPLEYYNTLLWAPGEVVVDGYAVPVDAGAPPGEYYLNVGYYLTVGESAVNLPLVVDGQMTEASSVTIGPIEVVQ